MSRSCYTEDSDDNWRHIMWRGAVASAIKGARGQAFLKEMLAALDVIPGHTLVADALEADGAVCAMGAVGRARGVNMTAVDPEDYWGVARLFGIADALAREIAFINDDEFACGSESPERRWVRVRAWVASQIAPETPA